MKNTSAYNAMITEKSTGKLHDVDQTSNLLGQSELSGPLKGVGTPISKADYTEPKKRYFAFKGQHDTEFVTFGREAILSILNQTDCAGIKFYFVERMDTTTKQLTLVLAGVDENNNDLNTVTPAGEPTGKDTFMVEFGSGQPPHFQIHFNFDRVITSVFCKILIVCERHYVFIYSDDFYLQQNNNGLFCCYLIIYAYADRLYYYWMTCSSLMNT